MVVFMCVLVCVRVCATNLVCDTAVCAAWYRRAEHTCEDRPRERDAGEGE